jgi:hypothetical protein
LHRVSFPYTTSLRLIGDAVIWYGKPMSRVTLWLSLTGLAVILRTHLHQPRAGLQLLLDDAFALFKRLGIDAQSITAKEFTIAYFVLAKRYHPDRGNQASHELMANINAARSTIMKCYRMG